MRVIPQVRVDATGQPRALELLPDKTLDGRASGDPVGGRLRAVLDIRRSALEATLGDDMDPTARAEAVRVACVFGNEIGERVTTTSRYLRSTPLRLERALARMEGTEAAVFTSGSTYPRPRRLRTSLYP